MGVVVVVVYNYLKGLLCCDCASFESVWWLWGWCGLDGGCR